MYIYIVHIYDRRAPHDCGEESQSPDEEAGREDGARFAPTPRLLERASEKVAEERVPSTRNRYESKVSGWVIESL